MSVGKAYERQLVSLLRSGGYCLIAAEMRGPGLHQSLQVSHPDQLLLWMHWTNKGLQLPFLHALAQSCATDSEASLSLSAPNELFCRVHGVSLPVVLAGLLRLHPT